MSSATGAIILRTVSSAGTAMAHKLELSELKDLINLTFCCQETTVITDFSDLAHGLQHPHALVADDELHAIQAASAQPLEEADLTGLILFHSFSSS